MDLTTERLEKFIGGQLEIQNPGEGYLLRGEIATVEVTDHKIRVTWAWVAKGEGFPPLPERWVNHDPRPWSVDLLHICGPSDAGNTRMMISTAIGETVVFHPPGVMMLNPANVEGLVLPA